METLRSEEHHAQIEKILDLLEPRRIDWEIFQSFVRSGRFKREVAAPLEDLVKEYPWSKNLQAVSRWANRIRRSNERELRLEFKKTDFKEKLWLLAELSDRKLRKREELVGRVLEIRERSDSESAPTENGGSNLKRVGIGSLIVGLAAAAAYLALKNKGEKKEN